VPTKKRSVAAVAELPKRRPPLTLREAAEYLNVTERWVQRAVAERRIQHIKGIGHGLRFDPDALDRMVSEHTVEAEA
jgi:excisionase family DNA binding protein